MENRIIQSKHDPRVYKSVLLSNKLLCLLISDKDCDKSAASMSVCVGTLEDPQERQGLAHFCEHMLFLGTEKYPDSSEYQAYLSKNSGASNAYTSDLETNYHFSSSNQAFEDALDRFSQFFIKPLFTENLSEREMNAVHSEHQKNLQQDFWRQYHLLKTSSIEGNTFSKFGTGDLSTLKHENIRDDLLKFYEKYYSSNQMKLVIYSDKEIDILEQIVEKYFKDIKNKDINSPIYKDIPFDSSNMKQFWKIVPVNNNNQLKLSWVIDNMQEHYKSSPINYLSHLIGHEGENSLLSLLIHEGLAEALGAGSMNFMKLFDIFNIEINLTKKGLQNQPLVLNFVFKYLKMLKEKSPQEYIFSEIQKVNNLKFDNKDKEKPESYVSTLTNRMHSYPIEDILRMNYLMEEYQPELIKKTLESLKFENLRIYLITQEVEKDCDKTEKIYGTQYSFTNIPEEIQKSFENPICPESDKKLDLPVENIFIPQNMSIEAKNFETLPKFPQKIQETEISTVWFKQDNQFKNAKGNINAMVYIEDQSCLIPEQRLYGIIWKRIWENYVRELQYLAEMAYVFADLGRNNQTENYFEFQISGFNDSMKQFCQAYFKKLSQFDPETMKQEYEIQFQKTKRELGNFAKGQPYNQVIFYSKLITTTGVYDPIKEENETINNLNFEEFVIFSKQLFQKCRFEWLLTGNFSQEQALDIVNVVENELKQSRNFQIFSKNTSLNRRVVNLSSENTMVWERELQPKETNSSIQMQFQFEKNSIQNEICHRLLENVLHEPYFSQLRTKEQLGYVVFSYWNQWKLVTYHAFLIQSNVKSPQYLSKRIYEFIESQKEYINEMKDEQFEEFKKSILNKIKQKDLNIFQESERYWNRISLNDYMFDKREILLENVPKITKKEFQEFFKNIFFEKKKCLEMHLIAAEHQKENEEIKKDRLENFTYTQSVELIKQTLPLYPDFLAKQ